MRILRSKMVDRLLSRVEDLEKRIAHTENALGMTWWCDQSLPARVAANERNVARLLEDQTLLMEGLGVGFSMPKRSVVKVKK